MEVISRIHHDYEYINQSSSTIGTSNCFAKRNIDSSEVMQPSLLQDPPVVTTSIDVDTKPPAVPKRTLSRNDMREQTFSPIAPATTTTPSSRIKHTAGQRVARPAVNMTGLQFATDNKKKPMNREEASLREREKRGANRLKRMHQRGERPSARTERSNATSTTTRSHRGSGRSTSTISMSSSEYGISGPMVETIKPQRTASQPTTFHLKTPPTS